MARGNEFEAGYERGLEFQDSKETIQPENGRDYDCTPKVVGTKAKFEIT